MAQVTGNQSFGDLLQAEQPGNSLAGLNQLFKKNEHVLRIG
jgi:hypothetical protein